MAVDWGAALDAEKTIDWGAALDQEAPAKQLSASDQWASDFIAKQRAARAPTASDAANWTRITDQMGKENTARRQAEDKANKLWEQAAAEDRPIVYENLGIDARTPIIDSSGKPVDNWWSKLRAGRKDFESDEDWNTYKNYALAHQWGAIAANSLGLNSSEFAASIPDDLRPLVIRAANEIAKREKPNSQQADVTRGTMALGRGIMNTAEFLPSLAYSGKTRQFAKELAASADAGDPLTGDNSWRNVPMKAMEMAGQMYGPGAFGQAAGKLAGLGKLGKLAATKTPEGLAAAAKLNAISGTAAGAVFGVEGGVDARDVGISQGMSPLAAAATGFGVGTATGLFFAHLPKQVAAGLNPAAQRGIAAYIENVASAQMKMTGAGVSSAAIAQFAQYMSGITDNPEYVKAATDAYVSSMKALPTLGLITSPLLLGGKKPKISQKDAASAAATAAYADSLAKNRGNVDVPFGELAKQEAELQAAQVADAQSKVDESGFRTQSATSETARDISARIKQNNESLLRSKAAIERLNAELSNPTEARNAKQVESPGQVDVSGSPRVEDAGGQGAEQGGRPGVPPSGQGGQVAPVAQDAPQAAGNEAAISPREAALKRLSGLGKKNAPPAATPEPPLPTVYDPTTHPQYQDFLDTIRKYDRLPEGYDNAAQNYEKYAASGDQGSAEDNFALAAAHRQVAVEKRAALSTIPPQPTLGAKNATIEPIQAADAVNVQGPAIPQDVVPASAVDATKTPADRAAADAAAAVIADDGRPPVVDANGPAVRPDAGVVPVPQSDAQGQGEGQGKAETQQGAVGDAPTTPPPSTRDEYIATLEPQIVKMARRMARGQTDAKNLADELAQEARTKLMEEHAKFDPSKGLYGAWGNTVITRAMNDVLRERGVEVKRKPGGERVPEDQVPSKEPTPDEQAEKNEQDKSDAEVVASYSKSQQDELEAIDKMSVIELRAEVKKYPDVKNSAVKAITQKRIKKAMRAIFDMTNKAAEPPQPVGVDIEGDTPKAAPTISYEDFSKQYRDAFKHMGKYKPDEVGMNHYADKMADLADKYPDHLARFEAEEDVKARHDPTDTIAGRMTLDDFEKKEYQPDEVTQEDWVNMQRRARRSMGQSEESGTRYAPYADYEEFHKDAVKKALAKGDEVDERVLADYPDHVKKPEGAPENQQVKESFSDAKDGDVYKINTKDGVKYAVRNGDNGGRGFGNHVFSTPEEAAKEAAAMPERRASSKAAQEQRDAANKTKADEEAAIKAKRENLQGFGDDRPNLEKKRIIATLDKQASYKNKVMTRREKVEAVVADGAQLRVEGGEDRIYSFDGRVEKSDGTYQEGVDYFHGFNKTETDYAKHLIKMRDVAVPVAPPPELAAPPAAASDAKPAAKEPWQMTRDEFMLPLEDRIKAANIANRKHGVLSDQRGAITSEMEYDHLQAVKNAFAAGQPVPPEVLADYPDLAPKKSMVPAKEPVEPDLNAAIAQAKASGKHLSVYNGKVVPGDEFKRAAMRVSDNAGDGYVVTPKGEVFEISRSSKKAKRISVPEAKEPVAAPTEPTPTPDAAKEPPPRAEPPAVREQGEFTPKPIEGRQEPITPEEKAKLNDKRDDLNQKRIQLQTEASALYAKKKGTRKNAHKMRAELDSQARDKEIAVRDIENQMRVIDNRLSLDRVEGQIDNAPDEATWLKLAAQRENYLAEQSVPNDRNATTEQTKNKREHQANADRYLEQAKIPITEAAEFLKSELSKDELSSVIERVAYDPSPGDLVRELRVQADRQIEARKTSAPDLTARYKPSWQKEADSSAPYTEFPNLSEDQRAKGVEEIAEAIKHPDWYQRVKDIRTRLESEHTEKKKIADAEAEVKRTAKAEEDRIAADKRAAENAKRNQEQTSELLRTERFWKSIKTKAGEIKKAAEEKLKAKQKVIGGKKLKKDQLTKDTVEIRSTTSEQVGTDDNGKPIYGETTESKPATIIDDNWAITENWKKSDPPANPDTNPQFSLTHRKSGWSVGKGNKEGPFYELVALLQHEGVDASDAMSNEATKKALQRVHRAWDRKDVSELGAERGKEILAQHGEPEGLTKATAVIGHAEMGEGIGRIQNLAAEVPEFAYDPVMTVDKNGGLVYRDGYKYTFPKGSFGTDGMDLKTGDTVGFNLEDLGIKRKTPQDVVADQLEGQGFKVTRGKDGNVVARKGLAKVIATQTGEHQWKTSGDGDVKGTPGRIAEEAVKLIRWKQPEINAPTAEREGLRPESTAMKGSLEASRPETEAMKKMYSLGVSREEDIPKAEFIQKLKGYQYGKLDVDNRPLQHGEKVEWQRGENKLSGDVIKVDGDYVTVHPDDPNAVTRYPMPGDQIKWDSGGTEVAGDVVKVLDGGRLTVSPDGAKNNTEINPGQFKEITKRGKKGLKEDEYATTTVKTEDIFGRPIEKGWYFSKYDKNLNRGTGGHVKEPATAKAVSKATGVSAKDLNAYAESGKIPGVEAPARKRPAATAERKAAVENLQDIAGTGGKDSGSVANPFDAETRAAIVAADEAQPEHRRVAEKLAIQIVEDMAKNGFTDEHLDFSQHYNAMEPDVRKAVVNELKNRGLLSPMMGRKRNPPTGSELVNDVKAAATRLIENHNDRTVPFNESDAYKKATAEFAQSPRAADAAALKDAIKRLGKPGGPSSSSFIGITADQVEAIKDIVVNATKYTYHTVEEVVKAIRENLPEWKDSFEKDIRKLWDDVHGKTPEPPKAEPPKENPPEPPKATEPPKPPKGEPVGSEEQERGINNAYTEMVRIREGMPEREKVERRAWAVYKREAEKLSDNEVTRQVKDIGTRDLKKEPVTEPEAWVLGRRTNEIENRLMDARASGDKEATAAAQVDLAEILGIDERAGSEAGRILAQRRAMWDADFSLTGIARRWIRGKRGPLSETEWARAQKIAADLIMERAGSKESFESVSKAIDEIERELKENRIPKGPSSRPAGAEPGKETPEDKISKIIKDAKKKPKAEPVPEKPIEPEVKSLLERIMDKWEKSAQASRDWLSTSSFFSIPINPEALVHLANVGAYHLSRGILDISSWTGAMIKEVGEKFKASGTKFEDYRDQIWEASNKAIDKSVDEDGAPADKRSKAKEVIHQPKPEKPIKKPSAPVENPIEPESEIKTPEDISEKISKRYEKTSEITSTAVRELAKAIIISGVHGVEPVSKAVHDVLLGIDPDITRQQSNDLLSGRGQVHKASEDPIDRELTDVKRQRALIDNYEGLRKTPPEIPLATGFKPQETSDTERHLRKKLNEEKKRHPELQANRENQLKGASQARETALTNWLKDRYQEILTGEEIVKNRRPLDMNERLKVLQEERDRVNAIHKEAFPPKELTPEQKEERIIRGLQKAADSIEANVKAGKLGGKKKWEKQSSVKIDAARARLEEVKQLLAEARELDPKYQAEQQAKQDTQRETAAQKRIAILKEQLLTGKFPEKAKPGRPLRAEVQAELDQLQKQVAAKKKSLGNADTTAWEGEGGATDEGIMNARQLATYKRILAKKEADLISRIAEMKATGKVQPKIQRSMKTKLDKSAREQKIRIQKLEDEAVETERALHANFTERVGSFLGSVVHGNVFGSASVVEHIGGAVLWKIPGMIVDELSRSLLSKVPGFRKFAGPLEGRGDVVKFLKELGNLKQTGRNMADQMLHHGSALQREFGKKFPKPVWAIPKPGASEGKRKFLKIAEYATEGFGRAHAVMKEVERSPAEALGLSKVMADAKEHGEDVNDPEVRKRIADVVDWANRQILMQERDPDTVHRRWTAKINPETGHKSIPGLAKEVWGHGIQPVFRVGMNFASEVMERLLGVPVGLTQLAWGRKIHGSLMNIPEKQRQDIARKFVYGVSALPAMLALGWYGYKHFGGYYIGQDRPKDQKLDEGEIEFGDVKVPKELTYSPMVGALQAVAQLRYIWEDHKNNPEKQHSLLSAAARTGAAIFAKTPIGSEAKVLSDMSTPERVEHALGQILKTMVIPGMVAYYAKHTDKDAYGNLINRDTSKDFSGPLYGSIPGLRQQLEKKKPKKVTH